MWFPVELHSVSAVSGGLLAALREHLLAHEHHVLVHDRRLVGYPIDRDSGEINRVVEGLAACSIAYVGTQHLVPVAPFAAFTAAPELGIAYLETLIDQDAPGNGSGLPPWLTNGVGIFVFRLFREHPQITEIVLPFPIGSAGGITEREVAGHFHLSRDGNQARWAGSQ